MDPTPTTARTKAPRPESPPRTGEAALPLVVGAATLIVPTRRRLRLRDLPAQLPVIRVVAARDYKVKYKQSLLGPLWLVFQPLVMLGALVIAFDHVANVQTSGVSYVLFAMVGLSVWAFFQASVNMGTVSLVNNPNLIRRTACPRFAFPLSSVIASLPSLAIPTAAAIVLSAAEGQLSVRALLLPLAIVWVFVFTVGVVAISSPLTVRFHDIISALPFLLQVGVFVTPVGYPTSNLSPAVNALVSINPLTGIIDVWRWMLLGGESVDMLALACAISLSVATVVLGWRVFSRLEVSMADEI